MSRQTSHPDLADLQSFTDRWRVRRDEEGLDVIQGQRGHVSAHDLAALCVYLRKGAARPAGAPSASRRLATPSDQRRRGESDGPYPPADSQAVAATTVVVPAGRGR
jgi:hypothetical protein